MKKDDDLTEHKYKMLHYRRAKSDKTDKSLQDLLTASLRSKPFVKDRYQLLNVDDQASDESDLEQVKMFVNHTSTNYSILFGEIVRYSDGAFKSMVKVDDSATHLSIEQVAPPKAEDGKQREFLDSLMYFAVFDNHVVIIQSSLLLIRDFEKHINWLLKEADIHDNPCFLMTKEIPKEHREQIEKANTKSLRIGTPLVETIDDKPVQEAKKYIDTLQTKNVKFSPSGRSLDFIKELIPEAIRDKFDLSNEKILADALKGSDLQVSVEISYKRKATKQSQDIINSFSSAFRHMNPEDIEVEIDFDKVGKLKGKQLSIQKKLNVKYYDGVIDILDLQLKIRDWLTDQINLEEIEAA
ncbi:hypothetical protein [Aliivibrio logei]|uniref:hypothetical protein n=1 Tax=Aliivibrio logei TaxID=688 RepID=UPI0035C8CCA1